VKVGVLVPHSGPRALGYAEVEVILQMATEKVSNGVNNGVTKYLKQLMAYKSNRFILVL
jgi:hypothetical protein